MTGYVALARLLLWLGAIGAVGWLGHDRAYWKGEAARVQGVLDSQVRAAKDQADRDAETERLRRLANEAQMRELQASVSGARARADDLAARLRDALRARADAVPAAPVQPGAPAAPGEPGGAGTIEGAASDAFAACERDALRFSALQEQVQSQSK